MRGGGIRRVSFRSDAIHGSWKRREMNESLTEQKTLCLGQSSGSDFAQHTHILGRDTVTQRRENSNEWYCLYLMAALHPGSGRCTGTGHTKGFFGIRT